MNTLTAAEAANDNSFFFLSWMVLRYINSRPGMKTIRGQISGIESNKY